MAHGIWAGSVTQPSHTNAYGVNFPQTNSSDLSAEDSIMVIGSTLGISTASW